MGSYTLSGEADADVQSIAEESVKRCGLERAEKYYGEKLSLTVATSRR